MGAEKILDESVVDFMLDAGVDIGYIKARQYLEMKRLAIDKLKAVISLIEHDDQDSIIEHISESPSGDGWGKDNHYISFVGDRDIFDVLEYLRKRKKYLNEQDTAF